MTSGVPTSSASAEARTPPTTSSPFSTAAVSGKSSRRERELVVPPILDHLRVAGTRVRSANQQELGTLVARFEASHRVAVHPHGVPLLEVVDLLLDLDARAAIDEDVDLLLLLV